MHLTGLEPALLSEMEPKSIVYANFTTGAYVLLIFTRQEQPRRSVSLPPQFIKTSKACFYHYINSFTEAVSPISSMTADSTAGV